MLRSEAFTRHQTLKLRSWSAVLSWEGEIYTLVSLAPGSLAWYYHPGYGFKAFGSDGYPRNVWTKTPKGLAAEIWDRTRAGEGETWTHRPIYALWLADEDYYAIPLEERALNPSAGDKWMERVIQANQKARK